METDNDPLGVISSDDERIYVPPRKTGHKRTSISWQFFDRDNDVFAKCKLCNKNISHRSAVSNLTKHIKRAHHSEFQKIHRDLQTGQVDGEVAYLDENNTESNQNEIDEINLDDVQMKDTIWKYFNLLDKCLKIVSCTICNKRINFSTQADLLHHFKKKHNNDFLPNKNVRVLVTENNDIFEIEEIIQSKEDAMGIEYDHLQDIPTTNENFQVSEEPKKKRIKHTEPIMIKQNNAEDHIDLFGKYLTSLLRKLPSQVSNKLQADFVRQAMEVSEPGTSGVQVHIPSTIQTSVIVTSEGY